MSKTLKVLIVDDVEDDVVLLVRELRHGDYNPLYLRVDRPEAMKNALEKSKWDLVISDFTMPHFNGMSALAVLQETGLDIPFIIVSGSIGEDVAVACMKAGASDYIMKNNLHRLVPAVARELSEAEERRARRAAEEKLRAAERLQMVGQVAASIIHDLKNPMQVILGNLDFLNAEGLASPDKRKKYSGVIEKQVERMLGMCQEILDFARGEVPLALEPVNLLELCRDLAETYERSFTSMGVQLSCSGRTEENTSPFVLADKERIWRVITNLIGNARDVLTGGGTIRVSAAVRAQGAEIEVWNDGPGIPEEIQDKIFDPFFSHGKAKGTGLGLSICKKIVEAHGGKIDFSSEAGAGTAFRIVLPVQIPPPLPSTTSSGRKLEKRE
ncbi:MAG: hybrid sensor histidine kinase/response regulator [candidate division Zixibacteria bacterium]|nr:hybrid sensor histidine kinase/response regulator [candidate division Zixibacteria bacterium]